ncbi:hypothetical protein RI129_001805 [Pyrocoelia pectoralis]|uniref:DNA-directed DNA polymerase n=1 Tax=Pyrocoelia pectoralis TaxID=417401 RepID=A0AAN7VVQ5_9COLE
MLKVNVVLACNFIQPQNHVVDFKSFGTKNYVIDITTNIHEWYKENVYFKLQQKLEEFAEKDSGWALYEVLHLKTNINSYVPFVGGLSTFVKVPYFIAVKHAVVNVQNDDEYCFLWAVVSALHPIHDHSDRVWNYPHFSEVLKYDSINFPIKLDDIKKFEKLNNLAINLFCIRGKAVLPFVLSNNQKSDKQPINLLALQTNYQTDDSITDSIAVKNNMVYHFVWIKNMSALFSKQLSNKGHRKFICNRCLNYFSADLILQKHTIHCHQLNQCSVRMPNESERYLEFKNFLFQEKVAFVIYADLESILEQNLNCLENNCTAFDSKHIPFSIAYYLRCSYNDSLSRFRLYRGKDCISWFIKELYAIAQWANVIINNVIPMETLTPSQVEQFQNASVCHICMKPFTDCDIKVRDHNHFTGKYRGASHQECNLNYTDSHVLPVVFHNLSGYDSHFIIRELATNFAGHVSLLPVNKERYISFTKVVEGTKIRFRFIDSFRFMSTSIEKLCNYLENDKKIITRANCRNDDEFSLLIRKGVFPYEYIDSWNKLNDTSLPPKHAFYSHLCHDHISDESYNHALNVWNKFNIKSLGEYSDLYLKTDVLLLADIFENFRQTCLNTYKLDPLHYYTAPGLAFDAMLKITQVQLELLLDVDMIMFLERGIRGGVAQCSNRYAKANNKYMGDQYDPASGTVYLMYYDVNNLYGAAMSEFLPFGEFSFVDESNFASLDIINHPNDSEIGYILDCDLDYPVELHENHSDLPLAPEHMVPPAPSSTSN